MSIVTTSHKAAETQGNRRLLVVAFHYLPDNTSTGVLRTLKFTRYLADHGWSCDVVSVPERLYVRTDPASLAQVPTGVWIHRPWAADVKRLFGIRGVYPDLLALPDRYWPWIPGAVRAGRALIARNGIEAIYTTYPPASALMIGLRLKRLTGLPWVVDLRDPWVEDSMPPLRRWIEGWMETKVLRGADRVICNTPAMRRWFLERYPGLPPERLVTITNGYDELDFADLVPVPAPGFEVLYPGMISAGNRNPEPLLAGMAMARREGRLPLERVRLTFLGTGPYGRDPRFHEALVRHGLADITDVVADRIPYRQALGRMAGTDILVVLSEPLGDTPRARAMRVWSHLQVPAKVYEYLRIGRPLLALVSGGAVAELLRDTCAGAPVSPTDTEGIAAFLGDAYRSRIKRTPHRPRATVPESVSRYSRQALSAKLAEVLEDVTTARV